MIGRRSAATSAAILAVGGAALLFGLRAADPFVADPASAADRAIALARASVSAAAATDAVEEMLRAAAEDARRGAARTVSGSDPPADPLLAAAERLEAGAALLQTAARAYATLGGTAGAVEPTLVVPRWDVDAVTLTSIAGQLRDAAQAATIFVGRRHTTETVLDGLAGALGALQVADTSSAGDRIAEARAATDELVAWQPPPAALVLWLDTTRDMLDAVDAMRSAMAAGDQAGLTAAQQRYAAAAALARQADTALAISLSEGAAATTALPLTRLGRLLGDVDDLRLAISTLLGP